MTTGNQAPRQIAGRYSLDAQIGHGGMGVVWRGTDRILGRVVALKRVGLMPGGTEADLRRAEREARLAARLNHPNIVAVFDLVKDGHEDWLVMEYVEGESLGQRLRSEGPMSPAEAGRLLGQAADALAVAHEAGILHRDVKPSNMLLHGSRLKLADFGIARASADATLTQTGLVTGSPAYLAPEVASGGRSTAASDVWSLGATLFHALEGVPPFDTTGNVMAGMYQIVHGPPPRSLRAGELSVVMENTLTKDPADRWSMAQVRDALAGAPPPARSAQASTQTQATAPVPALPPPPPAAASQAAVGADSAPAAIAAPFDPQSRSRPRRRWLAPALAALLLVAGVGVGYALLSDRNPEASSPSGGSTPSTEPSSSPTSEAPTRQNASAFVREYLALATRDPGASWPMLTPEFQDASGGFDSYAGFWSGVETATASSISFDRASSQVSYDVRYERRNGSTVSDSVVLRLQETDDGFLIAGES